MNSSLVEAEELSFSYGPLPVLSRLTFKVAEGEAVAFVGQSGCGKTTLFRLLAGLEQGQSGRLTVRAPLSYMMQQDLLLPWRTLLGNTTLAAELSSPLSSDLRVHAEELLALVGLKGVSHRYPNQLSGGQRQRAALARSLLQGRPILLLDEPFGQLDPITREGMVELVQRMKREYRKTVLLITHDVSDALSLADRILQLSGGQIAREWRVPSTLEERHQLQSEIYSALR